MSWETWLQGRFPAYLLPHAGRASLSRAEANRFLERISGRPGDLHLLRGAAVISAHLDPLEAFVHRHLPDLVRVLPGRTEVRHRIWHGGCSGLLDIPATLALRQAGDATVFVTRQPRRTFDRPENVLVHSVASRILSLLKGLRETTIVSDQGWSAPAAACEGRLRHLLQHTRLKDIPQAPIEGFHVHAARHAPLPCYNAALAWYDLLREGLDTDDPARIAEVLRRGALGPLNENTRFEVAVLIRLIEAVDTVGRDRGWTLDLGLIHANRRDVASLRHPSGRRICFHYNQAVLDRGPRDLGVEHYFGSVGRYRPDIVVTVEQDDPRQPLRAVVIEVKHSDQGHYLIGGMEEAFAYRWEYARWLTGWPRSVLVASGPVPGLHRPDDDVIAFTWDRWVPLDVAAAIVEMGCHP